MDAEPFATEPSESGLLTLARSCAPDLAGRGTVEVLSWSRGPGGSLVCAVGAVVVKVHRLGTQGQLLALRLRLARHPLLAPVLLTPVSPEPWELDGRWVSFWPRALPVRPEARTAPWGEAARLLAALHRIPVSRLSEDLLPVGSLCEGPWPEAGHLAGLDRALDALSGAEFDPEVQAVVRARQGLSPEPSRGRSSPEEVLVHGDWHFGQLLHTQAGWRLGDVDDLGRGDPWWDLGRVAAFEAIGVLTAGTLASFLREYHEAGGPLDWPADPATATRLDEAARAHVVRAAATGLAASRASNGPLDPVTAELVDACRRMACR